MTVKITLACTECKQRNYNTTKNKKNNPDRLEMKKYCRFCKKHTVHRETNTVVVLITVAIAAVVMILLDAIFGGILGLIIGA